MVVSLVISSICSVQRGLFVGVPAIQITTRMLEATFTLRYVDYALETLKTNNMTRLEALNLEQATGQVKELFTAIW